MKKHKQRDIAPFLYKIGVSFFNFGEVLNGKIRLFDFFQCDKVTSEQLEKIRAFCPDVQLKITGPQYAPEIKRQTLFFPKSAFYKLKG